MRKQACFRVLLLGVFMSAGCVSSNMMAIGKVTYPPRPEDYIIDVYATTDAPVQVMKEIANLKPLTDVPVGAKEIGRIDTNGAAAASWGSVIDDAKKKARMLGGDGIVISAWGQPMTAMDQYGNAYYGKALSMKVIRRSP